MSDHEKFSRIALENGVFETRLTRKFEQRKPYEKHNPGIIKAVIPGVVAEIGARVGAPVSQGSVLMILEAMKMLNRISAPRNGTVKAIRVKTGQRVSKGQVLIEIE